MFYVNESREARHERLRSFQGKEIGIGVILAAVDFEWTVRRCIIACGQSPTKVLRTELLPTAHGTKEYRHLWNREVFPACGARLEDFVPDWEFVRKSAFPLRHRFIHGVIGSTEGEYARVRRDFLLAASAAICDYAQANGIDLYARLRVRRNAAKQGHCRGESLMRRS